MNANLRKLHAELEDVRTALRRLGGPEAAPTTASDATPDVSRASSPGDDGAAPLDELCRRFSLSSFERRMVLLCVGVEVDPEIAHLSAVAQDNPRTAFVTFGLVLRLFADAEWSAFAPSAPLRRWHILDVAPGVGVTTRAVRIDERVLHYLTGVDVVDERLHGFSRVVASPSALSASQREAALRIAEAWAQADEEASWPTIHLSGGDPASGMAVAAAACAALGFRLHAAHATDLPLAFAERDVVARLWERETVLGRRALLIEDDDAGAESSRALQRFLETTQGFFVVSGREPLHLRHRRILRIDVDPPSAAEQKAIWQAALGATAETLNGQLDRVATHFTLSPGAIRDASADVLQRCPEGDESRVGAALWEACRTHARPRLATLAARVEAIATWNDLVLPPVPLQTLHGIAAHVRRRALVYDTWGFGRQSRRGLGISALFSGASGTGKTMAAEVLANELQLDLYRIDLSTMVSKYIGETEKNLRRVFDAAEESGAILLFDEADALFGRRSEVKDSHDRYANIEVSYLLQRLETYRGLAILTSNLKQALDPAFLRRLRFIVHFPFPDSSQRVELWRRAFPTTAPTQALNVELLARLNVSGGTIRNLAFHAAFLAADADEPITMKHLLAAAHTEYVKLEKPLGEAEIGGWL